MKASKPPPPGFLLHEDLPANVTDLEQRRTAREALIDQVHEERFAGTLAEEVVKLRARRAAKEIVDREQLAEDDVDIPEPVTLEELLDEADEDVEWRIEGVWPRGGNVLLSAGAKSGKTTTTGNVVRSLVDGARLFRVYPVEPITDGVVAVLDFEMPRNRVRRWLRDQGIRNATRLVVWTERGKARRFDVRDLTIRARWVARLRGANVKVWIIDCLSPALSALGIDENNNTEVGRILDGITATAEEAGVEEILLIHHMGHGAERSRGASRLLGWPDALWKIVRKRDEKNPAVEPEPDAPRYFSATGRDVDVKEGQLLFDPVSRHLTYAEGGRKSSEHAEALARALVWIRDNPSQSGTSVEKALTDKGMGRNAARQAIADAKTKSYVVTAHAGGKGNGVRLDITPSGREALRRLSGGSSSDSFADSGDPWAGEVYCLCGGWIEPFDVTHGNDKCRPCRVEAGAA